MNILNGTILGLALNEAALKSPHRVDYGQFYKSVNSRSEQEWIWKEAAEKIILFYRWASRDYFYEPRTDCWFSNKDLLKSYTELDLFEIWKEYLEIRK